MTHKVFIIWRFLLGYDVTVPFIRCHNNTNKIYIYVRILEQKFHKYRVRISIYTEGIGNRG